jgi:type VI secretion system secreted protein VgrG
VRYLMVTYKYNKPYYQLYIDGLDEGTVQILSFEGKETISRLFEYRFELMSKDPALVAEKILNKKATFILTRGEENPIQIHGIISHFEQHGKSPDYIFYTATLVPKLWRLGLNYQSVIFQNMTVDKIIKQVLGEAGLTGTDYRFELSESYPELEYAVQYQETDLDFISRRMEHYGIFYYFDHSGDTDVVVFTDSNDSLSAIKQEEDIYYNPAFEQLTDKETISDFTYQQKVVTGLVRLNDYNYRFPNNALTVENQIDSQAPGVFYEYGEHYKDVREGEFLARVRNEEIVCGSKCFQGKSDCRLLRAGFKFSIGNHYREEWNTEFIVTEVISQGNQRPLFPFLGIPKDKVKTYENFFTAILPNVPFRPARITPIPRIPGIMTARMETGSGDEYAFIDENGRYKFKVPFDLSDSTQGEASRQIRLSQAYSGPGYGIHFPNHADTEMVWSCIDGNVDRPLGLGTVPNPNNSSPSNSNNKMQNIIRTAAGNEMIMDDTIEETQIIMNTADAHNLLMDDKEDKIQVTTTQKNKILMDDKNQNITVQTTNGHVLIMDDKNTKITLQSKNGHRISINDTDGSENITLVDESGENTFVIDISNKKLVIKTENGDIDFHAPNGTIDVKATTFNLETSGDTTIKADANITAEAGGDCGITAGGNLSQEATGDLSQKGMNVSSEASMDHNTKGMNVSSEASMEHKSKGLNVTSEAGVNQQVKGTMITVQSSGPNTIKGMPVMIN